jgi:hypothetical protein
MGKPDPPAPSAGAPGGSGSSNPGSSSRHTDIPLQPSRPVLNDEDIPVLRPDDLPPAYSDIENGPDDSNGPRAPLLGDYPWERPGNTFPYTRQRNIDDDGNITFVSKNLDEDPALLEQVITLLAREAPRPMIRIHGYHNETVREKNRTETKRVTDFDVHVDLRPYLFSNPLTGASWGSLRTVENYEKARRGTVFRTTAPGFRGPTAEYIPPPSLTEWCHRYCASSAALKCFTLRRRMTGFDKAHMIDLLSSLVRSTNYRGKIDISFPTQGEYVYVMNDCWINRWRATTWIRWIFYLTFLWIITWPVLFFSTKKYEVAEAQWPFSVRVDEGQVEARKYVSLSEDQLYNVWARAIRRAVLGRRQGTLTQQDLIRAETEPEEDFAGLLGRASRIVRQTVNAMTINDTHIGWGYDS